QRAIRSLLGLGVIEEAIRHVRKSAAEVNKQAKQVGAGGELNKIASRLEAIDEDIGRLEGEFEDAKQQFTAFDEKVDETDRKIAAVLQKGDKEKLQNDMELAKRKIKRLDDQLAAANKEHSALFRGQAIATDLLAPILDRAFGKLEELHDEGKIPNTTIPVLEDRLAAEICICGETLKPGNPEGNRRRGYIQKLIDDSKRADEIQEVITDLYYGAKILRPVAGTGSRWREEYTKVVKSRDGLQTLRDETGRELRALELQLDPLPDTDIQGLRDTRRQYTYQRDRRLAKQSSVDTQLTGVRREREGLTAERNRLLREQKKGARILSELEVTQD